MFKFKVFDNYVLQRALYALMLILFVTWIVVDTASKPKNLISLAGYFVILFAFFVTSKHPTKVLWKYNKQIKKFLSVEVVFF